VVGTFAVIRKVLQRLRPYRLAFGGAIAQVLLLGLLELAKPWPLKVVVDNVLGGKPLPYGWGSDGTPRTSCSSPAGSWWPSTPCSVC
jgi:hypothetical protein